MSEQSGAAPAAPVSDSSTNADSGQPEISANNEISSASNSEAPGKEQAAEAIQDAVANGEMSQTEANKLLRKFELKVKGKTVTREVDLSDENYLKNRLQLAEVAQMEMQSRAEQEKLFKQIIESGKGDPLAFIKELYGIDPDELAVAHLEKKVEHLKKSPEVLAREKMEAELNELREKAKKLEEEKQNAEMTKLQSEAMQSLKEEISTAISAHTKLPNSEKFQRRVADAMQWAVSKGYEDVKAEDVVGIVEKEWQEEIAQFMDGAEEDIIEAYVGKKNLARLKAKNVAAIKAKQMPAAASQIKPTGADISASQEKPKQAINAKDFWRNPGKYQK